MRTALVLGLGVSGKAAEALLKKQGWCVQGFDDRVLQAYPIDWSSLDMLVVSPGVSPQHPIYQEAMARDVLVVGEAELALSQLCGQHRMVAVTGTNGKTTVTLLVAHVLNWVGKKACALGNVGIPLSEYVLCANPEEILVVELSSYQLETLKTPAFDAAVILNVTPDHLDRYASMKEYAVAKCQLGLLLKPLAPFFVHPQVLTLLRSYGIDEAAYHGNSEYIESFLPVKYREMGEHTADNIRAAWALCRVLGVTEDSFFAALDTFKKPSHRIEFVREIRGVSFFDDSKGTNVDAVLCSVQAMKGPVILIVGGVDKGGSYEVWKEPFAGKVKHMVALGQAAPKIIKELGTDFQIQKANSLEEAVDQAFAIAVPGDCVLLSPACSSYDMFRDYVHRGEVFTKKVLSI